MTETNDSVTKTSDTEQSEWRTESGVYITGDQPDKLVRYGYLTEDEREKLRSTGIISVESESGEDVTLCPDMWMAPNSIGPIVRVLGDRLGEGRLH